MPADDPQARARQICLRLLTLEPRTRAQLADQLRSRGIRDDVANEVLDRFADVGLIARVIVRLVVGGPNPIGFVRTILLGIAGAFLGGLIHWMVYRYPGEPFSFSENAWPGWLYYIGGASILVFLFSWWMHSQSNWRRWW